MQQLRSIIRFDQILSQKTAQDALDQALKYINSGSKDLADRETAKRRSHEFLTLIHNHLQSQKVSPQSKFYTLYILKLITQKDERTVLSVLTTHSLLKYMIFTAKSTDAYFEIEQKGRNLFASPKLGNDYIRLILESIKIWGQRFSSNKKNQSSHFKKAYDELLQRKVVMPQDLKFYNQKTYTTMAANTSISGRQISERKMSDTKISKTVINDPLQPAESQNMRIMQYDIDKIKEFLGKLEGNEYEKHCGEYHKLFLKQKEKYESIINNLISSNDEKSLQQALAINEFYSQQQLAYKEFLTHKQDYYSYVNLIQLKADELNGFTRKTPQAKQLVKKEVTVEVKQTRKNSLIDLKDNENKQILSKLKSKLGDNLQATSFRDIKESLSKDKSLGKARRSISGMKKSSVSKFGKSMTKSRISQIFVNPPNPYPQQKRYQGQRIDKNRDLEGIMKQITRNQGLRRFITSNFKTKNPLFENSHMQIGFKSEVVYEQVNEFRVILSLELFIGNKTDDQIIHLSIDYKGESDILMYGNPKCIPTYLSPGYQTKQELLIAPLNSKPSFIKMYLKYQICGQNIQEVIILPNSIVKLSQNAKISKKQFVQNWNAATIFRSQEFRLTRYIAPDSLTKYISSLSQLSSYDQFLEPNSQIDYEIGCQVILMRKYEGVLRISIRPNLNAIIQVGITDQDHEAHEGFTYYAQTLQMLLTHIDHQT